ncbi:MAG: carboxymuconolactone decarboxylase family protein, partial [Casimicrobium sp.]
MSNDRLPPLPPSQWSKAQRVEAEAVIKGPRGALISPFVPLLRSPELMGHAQRMGEYLRYRSALPL